jgi:hypothetical protein
LWSVHPSYLDQKALVAVWREGLLARAVLRGATRGYKNHPQLERFRDHAAPVSAINHYLLHIFDEASVRGYTFDRSKIGPIRNREKLIVTSAQLAFELAHLKRKVQSRAPGELHRLPTDATLRPHPLFSVRKGKIEPWEKGAENHTR